MNLRWSICFRLLVTNAKTLEVRLLLNLQILVSQACQLAWEATLIGLTRGVMELFELVGFGMYEEENNSNFNQIIGLFRRTAFILDLGIFKNSAEKMELADHATVFDEKRL